MYSAKATCVIRHGRIALKPGKHKNAPRVRKALKASANFPSPCRIAVRSFNNVCPTSSHFQGEETKTRFPPSTFFVAIRTFMVEETDADVEGFRPAATD